MNFKLSTRSNLALLGVKPALVACVQRAIQLTAVDFVVLEGLRTAARQAELVKLGASTTLNSKHITGDAVDLGAWHGTIRWEPAMYFPIAESMRKAAIEIGVAVRWGGAWTISDISNWYGTVDEAQDAYISARRAIGKKPFIDMPHY